MVSSIYALLLLWLQDKLTKAIDNGEYANGLFLDWSKAFDTINHKILADKLKFYVIRGIVLKLFESYLRNRNNGFFHLCHYSDTHTNI